MATRSKVELMVVISPTISKRACRRRTCNAQALSFPLLQESRTFLLIMAHHSKAGLFRGLNLRSVLERSTRKDATFSRDMSAPNSRFVRACHCESVDVTPIG